MEGGKPLTMIVGFAVVLVAVFLTGRALCGDIADNAAAVIKLAGILSAAQQ